MFTRAMLLGFLLEAALSFAQQQSGLTGDFAGSLGSIHIKLHLAGRDEALNGTIDSPDQGVLGMQCADIHVNGQTLSFSVPMVHGTWTGFIGGNGTSLSGTWNQGSPMPLNFSRVGTTSTATSSSPGPQAGAVAGNDSFSFDEGGFKFTKPKGVSFVTVQLTVTNPPQPAGTIIMRPGMEPMFDGLSPAYKPAAQAAYEKHFPPAGAPSQPVEEAKNVPPSSGEQSSPASPIKTQFNAASNSLTVPTDDQIVTFSLDKKDPSVVVTPKPSAINNMLSKQVIATQTFIVTEKKASAGGFFQKTAAVGTGRSGFSCSAEHASGFKSIAGQGLVIKDGLGLEHYNDLEGTTYLHQNNGPKLLALGILDAEKKALAEDPAHAALLRSTSGMKAIFQQLDCVASLR